MTHKLGPRPAEAVKFSMITKASSGQLFVERFLLGSDDLYRLDIDALGQVVQRVVVVNHPLGQDFVSLPQGL
jgi:hypothetical protein